MTQERIPFGPIQETGWEELAGAGQEAVNVIVDGKGSVRRRPGIDGFFANASDVVSADGFNGIHVSVGGNVYGTIAGELDQEVYRLVPSGSARLGRVIGGHRPTFAETQTLLVVAAGGRVCKVDLATDAFAKLGGDPPKSTHVVAQASRLLLRSVDPNTPDTFHYSAPQIGTGIAGFETWNGDGGSDSGPFTASARPDKIVALKENSNEVQAFGSTTFQNFAPDPVTRYAPINTREFGCAAAYSIVKDDQNFAWLDDRRRIVHSDGRTLNILSDPIKQTLDDMDTVSDCYGYRVVCGPTDALVWTFPSDGRTFAFQRGGGWSQWAGWSAGNWAKMPVGAVAHNSLTNDYLAGFSDGRVGKFRSDAYTDLGDEIHARVTTGFLDHGTHNRKACNSVRIALRRGHSTASVAPVAHIAWRDDLGDWRSPLPISIANGSDRDPVVTLRSLGVYRTRQWRFSFTGTDELALAGVTEDFDVLDS